MLIKTEGIIFTDQNWNISVNIYFFTIVIKIHNDFFILQMGQRTLILGFADM